MELRSYKAAAVIAFPPDEDYPRLTESRLAELAEHLEAVRRADCFRGVVITSDSKSFAVGADLGEIAALQGTAARQWAQTGQDVFNRIAAFPVPVVAAIRGYCLGGGLDLALACRERVATFDASFGHPGAALGLVTGWGGTQRLAQRVGKPPALQILLTAERIPATQALTMGLVDELVASQELIEVAARRAAGLPRFSSK